MKVLANKKMRMGSRPGFSFEIRHCGLICVINEHGFTFFDEETGEFLYLMNDYARKKLSEKEMDNSQESE